MLKKYLLLIFSVCFFYSYSQERRIIDSLINIVNKTRNEKLKLEYFEKLTTLYWNINTDTSKLYNTKFLNQSLKINDKTGILTSKIYEAVNSDAEGNIKTAQKQFQSVFKEINSSKNISKSLVLAKYHYNYGNFCILNDLIDSSLTNYNKAVQYYKKINDDKTIARIKLNIGYIHSKKNNFSESIEIYQSAIPILKKTKDWLGLSAVYGRIGYNYGILKMSVKAIEYHSLGLAIDEKNNLVSNKAFALLNIGSEYAEMKEYDKAVSYFIKSKKIFEQINDSDMTLNLELNLIQIQIEQGKVKKSLMELKKIENNNYLRHENKVILFQSMGNCLKKIKNYSESENYYQKALALAKVNSNEDKLIEINNDYMSVRLINNKDTKTLESLFLYDSLIKKKNNTENKIAFFNLETKYSTFEKEAKIKTQQLQIQKEKTNKYIAFSGIGLLLLLSGGSYFWFRNKQKQSNLKTQNTLLSLQQNLMEAELSNLNKQLDPHEIKNLLASISPEIQEKAPESYKKMLKLFNLTKASLNSNSITDSIENQLHQIDDFLSLEKSMLAIPLEYSIKNNIQNTQTQIPRLLLKNLVENAIKHGIKPQETGGDIVVKIEEKNNFIYISVDDTGKGRQQAISLDSGIGISTYQKLFATLNSKNKENATFEIIDKQQGTKVEVKIPTNYKYS